MKKRLPVMLLFCLIIYGSGYAKTIGFACIYNSDAPAESVELTTTLETELFEFCFNRGFIATSIEYIAGKSERYKDNASLIKRFDSSIDYLVALYCEYRQGGGTITNKQSQAVEWKSLQWKLVDFSSQSILYEETINPAKISETELKQKMKKTGQAIGIKILEAL